MKKTREFIDRALSLANNDGVKCPCSRCRNSICEDKSTLSLHLYKVGSMPCYELSVHHGESVHQTASVAEDDDTMSDDRMDKMLDPIRPAEDDDTTSDDRMDEMLDAIQPCDRNTSEMRGLSPQDRLGDSR
jgi:hypothetical protein